MRPPRKTVILLVVVLGTSALVGAAGRGTMAAFSSQTSNSVTTLTAANDYMPPAITEAKIKKNSGYSADYVKQGGGYYVHANVSADTGNPASGINAIRADVSNITTGQTSVALTTSGGPWTVEGVSYNYRSALLTANASLSEGSQTFSVTSTDNDSNSESLTGQTVTVDNTAPTATGMDVQTIDNGSIPGRAEAGDQIVYTFSEQMDPTSILASAGWTGASLTVRVRLNNGSSPTPDNIQVWNSANTTQTLLGTVYLPSLTYTGSNRTFSNSTMVQSGNTITVTLGTASGTVTTGSAGNNVWVPSTSAYDRAANNWSNSAGTTVTETGASDAEF
jgi:hypothetical protein